MSISPPTPPAGSVTSTTACPNCGSELPERNGERAKFCGQCGTTITSPPDAPGSGAPTRPPAFYESDVHEEVTVARELPDLSEYLSSRKSNLGRTLLDPAPFAAGAPSPEVRASARLTPVVPGPDAPINVIVPQTSTAKTQMMAQTLNDPLVAQRAQELRDAVLGAAATDPQAPPTGKPKANLHRTMLMGGEAAVAPQPVISTVPAPAPSDRPTSPIEESPRAADASPLSRSVLAPSSWRPPAALQGTMPLNQVYQPPTAGGVDVGRVVPVGTPEPRPQPPAQPTAIGPARPSGGPVHGAPALRTMLGMPASELPSGGGRPPAQQGRPPGTAPAPPPAQKTMMGVAIPGIAPTSQGERPPAGAPDLRSKQSTMLGVAIPGIAPTHDPQPGPPSAPHGSLPQHHPYGLTPQGLPAPAPPMPSQVQNTALGMMAAPEVKIVPRPKTLIDEPLPAAPQIASKRGIPALAVVGIVAALVIVLGGAGAYLALRNAGTLTAVPQLDETGRESLKIGCATCPDGTTVALGASSATVTAGAALLPLPAPLSIGDNDLAVKIDRPGAGRDEEVKVHVPVAYRVRADLATLNAKPPAITVRVEASLGSEVKIDDKPVALDATGRGSYAIDLSKETEGTGEAKTFERKIPFVITSKGGPPQTGQLTARTGIQALALDAPGAELYTDKTTAAVAGQTRPGSSVTIDGQSVPVDAQGHFGVRVELASVGEKPLEIVASAAPQAPRIVKVKVTRVASLADASKDLDARSPIAFDVFGADPASKVGQQAVVEGDVVDVRAGGGHTVLLIDSKRGCAKGASCLVRVTHGEEDKVARGDIVRAFGRVVGSVTASGKTVPEIDASLVLPVKAGK